MISRSDYPTMNNVYNRYCIKVGKNKYVHTYAGGNITTRKRSYALTWDWETVNLIADAIEEVEKISVQVEPWVISKN